MNRLYRQTDGTPNDSFITSQELEDMYPELEPEREDAGNQGKRAVFISKIGGT